MSAWDCIGIEVARMTRLRWDWSFVDAKIVWPIVFVVGICILLAALSHDEQPGNRHKSESGRKSITAEGRDQGA
jgi:hypothetical protein